MPNQTGIYQQTSNTTYNYGSTNPKFNNSYQLQNNNYTKINYSNNNNNNNNNNNKQQQQYQQYQQQQQQPLVSLLRDPIGPETDSSKNFSNRRYMKNNDATK